MPPDQSHGLYKGDIKLIGNPTTKIPIEIEVLPITLPAPDKLFGVFFRGSLENNKRQISTENLKRQLTDIVLHGISSLVIYEKSPVSIAKFLQIAKSVGIGGPIALSWPVSYIDKSHRVERALTICKRFGYECVFYGIDEPNSNKKLKEHNALFSVLDRNRTSVVTSLLSSTYTKMLKSDTAPHWANFNIQSDEHELANISADREHGSGVMTLYWQMYLEDAPRNRYFAGLYLEKTGLDGALPYCYQAFHSIDPYVTDERELRGSIARDNKLFKAFMTTYPTSGAPIPTIQWESYREGIDDYRYLMLFKDLYGIEELSESKEGREIAKVMDLISYTEPDARKFLVQKSFEARQLTNIRSKLIQLILARS